jgi:tetratricopeptide (TPR) repeat protein
MAAERGGDMDAAKQIFAGGMARFPGDASLANSAANLAMRLGDFELAERQFSQASMLDLGNLEFTLNRAIALARLGRHGQAISVLRPVEEEGWNDPKYCSARGAAERALGNLALAAKWYDRAIVLEPGHARALHGRARVSIEQGDPSAQQRFDAALAITQGDADLWLGKAQALDVAGDAKSAREIAEALVEQAPHWTEGLRFLAQLKLGAGETNFAGHYADAVRRVPQDPNIPFAWIALLEGNDRSTEAAEIAADARRKFPQTEPFALMEAVNSGSAGDDDRAEAIFAGLGLGTPDRHLQEARHRIRRGELDRAEGLLDLVLAAEAWNISAFALLGVIWRLKDDDHARGRARWLHDQAGLVRLLPLIGADETLPDLASLLRALHDNSALPLGQSLRGGTQTRGILFDRTEPVLSELRAALLETIKGYRAGLPATDTAHPLLRHRDEGWKLAGSWSVRLNGGGDFHTSHIHPQGLVSSALYLEVPQADNSEAQEGWLEVGRPPPDLRLDLPPLQTIEPKPGHLALFPSTLYHGTRPFSAGRRMTVAFDVTLSESERK